MIDQSHSQLKRRVFRLVEPAANSTPLERAVDILLLTIIIISTITFVIGTVPSVMEQYGVLLRWIEIITVIIFTLEYVAQLWSCTITNGHEHPVWGRLRYALKPIIMIDLFAILPFFLSAFGSHLLVLRVLRLFRIFRILKINRYSSALTAIRVVMREKGPELIIAISMMLTLILITSTLLFYAESDVPGTVFTSIPATMWTSVASLTPLGFGAAYPTTLVGQGLMMLTAIFGVGAVALPSGIFASGFSAYIRESHNSSRKFTDPQQQVQATIVCPHCNVPIDTSMPSKHGHS